MSIAMEHDPQKMSDQDLLDLIRSDPGLIASYKKRGPRLQTIFMHNLAFGILVFLGIIVALLTILPFLRWNFPPLGVWLELYGYFAMFAALPALFLWIERPAYLAYKKQDKLLREEADRRKKSETAST